MTKDELKIIISNYIFENKSESIIYLNVDEETKYKTYVDIQNTIINEIHILREKLAVEKYNTEFEKLTEEQASEIKKVYPENIVD